MEVNFLLISGLFLGFVGIELLYFRIARRFSIIDRPNERSSHTKPTIRGGGIIFPIAWLTYSIYNGGVFPLFSLGLLIISVVSFIDDIKALPVLARFFAHLLAFSLFFYELNLFADIPLWGTLLTLVICIGVVNAFNFMDGINGITGLYALSFFGLLMFSWHSFFGTAPLLISADNPFMYIVVSILAFGFFNFRKRARSFAGDVGSVSIGFIMLFFIIRLIFDLANVTFMERTVVRAATFDSEYILFLAVYGVDSVLTIIHRLLLRENIFKAHRKHLYQYLSNELGWPHLSVAFLYAALQLIINYRLVSHGFTLLQGAILLLFLALVYILAKYAIIHRHKPVTENNAIRR